MAEESSTPGLVRGILDDLRDLVREEIALARAEVREELAKAKDAALAGAIGIAALAVGVLFLLTFCALGLAALLNWPAWSGFLIVGIILVIVGGGMLLRARNRAARVTPGLPQTTSSVMENVEWIQARTTANQNRSGRRSG